MSDPNQIRINELARELEIKAKVLIDFLPEIGVKEKKTHSSSVDIEHAELARKHFRALARSRRSREEAAKPRRCLRQYRRARRNLRAPHVSLCTERQRRESFRPAPRATAVAPARPCGIPAARLQRSARSSGGETVRSFDCGSSNNSCCGKVRRSAASS